MTVTPVTGWWKRNRVGLIVLIPLILLAIAANSFRLVEIYLPWMSDRAIRVDEVHIPAERIRIDFPEDFDMSQTAIITPLSATPVGELADQYGTMVTPAPGAKLWTVEIQVNADPSFMLLDCRVSVLDEEGTEYETGLAQLDGDAAATSFTINLCVEYLQMGPTADLEGNYIPAELGSERPDVYTIQRVFTIPDGHEPAELRVTVGSGTDWIVPIP